MRKIGKVRDNLEWSLKDKVFQTIIQRLREVLIDLFAQRHSGAGLFRKKIAKKAVVPS